jgi:hypothetical protein
MCVCVCALGIPFSPWKQEIHLNILKTAVPTSQKILNLLYKDQAVDTLCYNMFRFIAVFDAGI